MRQRKHTNAVHMSFVMPEALDLNAAVAGMLKMLQRLIGEDIHLAWIPG